ncbi:DUF1801 domain-containing protein [Enterococcus caccae]|uniref:YdhG-like domain-containing protein n=1 Tax=Enterococcus caccae ATCC BAA-1240 TaxID=1158612 RepID=R3X8Y1_9ENTE|nr:DUF1801 domain-containing protein [Enterococcus caccae]EOL50520.1 hypothetical protein UC7_00293 [Enterococcus caccae ATCC BAA-1240]EOT59264.1 hypothetical protein I580_02296 [Enterococcus caccae ATCC BAA-1240]OJG26682.1 hypothetical protein RU98_GL000472 [Enterococcus caccae]
MKEMVDINVANVFEQYPMDYRQPLLQIRELIFNTAAGLIIVGELEESLKWNQPSYATKFSKSGSPIRIDRFGDKKIALFFHCQTTLVEEFRALFSDAFEFSKNRAIVLDPAEELPINELRFCIEQALTYHKR